MPFYHHHDLLYYHFRKQIIDRHTQRALRTMKPLSDFDRDFQYFVQEESRLQAERILGAKDPDKATFSIETVRQFSYKEQLLKFQKTNPILLGKLLKHSMVFQ